MAFITDNNHSLSPKFLTSAWATDCAHRAKDKTKDKDVHVSFKADHQDLEAYPLPWQPRKLKWLLKQKGGSRRWILAPCLHPAPWLVCPNMFQFKHATFQKPFSSLQESPPVSPPSLGLVFAGCHLILALWLVFSGGCSPVPIKLVSTVT